MERPLWPEGNDLNASSSSPVHFPVAASKPHWS